MKPLGETTRHYWMAQRMAKATQTDLFGAQGAGVLSQEKWADIVQTCRGCSWVDGCEHWLSKQDGNSEIPRECPNFGAYMQLKKAALEEQ
ncbi:hypothetical protein TG4357_02223 [Thalassovita gelatinovora]|uniref:DUF6455 domain-containing protein n=1 Tax=Thalassovita gelatinovora TaxID=53501 RepID=A0A0P1FZM3_THAGE|nr:DUF6455 family protein [Thalassovita gelatinovora]QIZ80571.1 hypothetical protein HFZ77_08780 [Thalassovita gelatinovora]CUH66079.1 hypothetical protein TG4357_02223 [Thalassovita gelatinovora]SEQ76515.1 hypothetical protein SAMN04488043_108172 [Thalassovita gelatinovora]